MVEPSFEAWFRKAQQQLGLQHYAVAFAELPADHENYADCDADAMNCTALVRWNPVRCRADDVVAATAAHEAAHLLLADLLHASLQSPTTVGLEEERVARRLEPLLCRALGVPFATAPTTAPTTLPA